MTAAQTAPGGVRTAHRSEPLAEPSEPAGPGPTRHAGPWWRDLDRPSAIAVVLGALLLLSFALRLEGIGTWYWIDEALTVGLASQPLHEIPGLLRLDGSPPLYYLLLHLWMQVFGTSEMATHALSLLFALACVPVAWWAGRSLFDRRAAWMTAALAALSPFLTHFANEARMYTLVTLLALLVATSFLHAFVFGRARHTGWFVLWLILLVYTHNWGLYLAAACVIALVPVLLAAADPRLALIRAVKALGFVAVAFLPWVPVLVSQIGATGAPWAYTPRLRELFGEIAALVRDERVLVLLVAVAGSGLLALMPRMRSRLGAAAWVLAVLAAGPVIMGWTVAHIEPSWATRYLAVVVGPLLIAVGWGLSRAGTAGLVAVVLSCLLWIQPFTRLEGSWAVVPEAKSDARALASEIDERLADGDLLIVAQPEAVALFASYVERDVTFVTTWGIPEEPLVMDWRHALDRLRATSPERDLLPLLEQVPPGGRVALVGPGARLSRTDTEWIRLFHDRHRTWRAHLNTAEGWQHVTTFRADTEERARIPFVVSIFERTR
jgi:hypothetical protein